MHFLLTSTHCTISIFEVSKMGKCVLSNAFFEMHFQTASHTIDFLMNFKQFLVVIFNKNIARSMVTEDSPVCT